MEEGSYMKSIIFTNTVEQVNVQMSNILLVTRRYFMILCITTSMKEGWYFRHESIMSLYCTGSARNGNVEVPV